MYKVEKKAEVGASKVEEVVTGGVVVEKEATMVQGQRRRRVMLPRQSHLLLKGKEATPLPPPLL
jgi:hypothetical protein